MNSFIQKHAASVTGILSGFDRLVLRGTIRSLCFAEGMMGYLWANRILLKEFGAHVAAVSERIKEASLRRARRLGREVRYLASSRVRKEEVAREIAERDRISRGLICVLTCVEPCRSFEVYRNRATKRLELQPRLRKCLHYYHYWLHPQLGLMHARLQTWFPLSIQVCLNGREWLARSLEREGVRYQRRENCFPWLGDVPRAQKLFDAQLATDWPELLARIARRVNPLHEQLFARSPRSYYWTVHQSEWATDVMFRSAAELRELYPRLLRHGITTFASGEVLRFLGHRVPAHGGAHGRFAGEVVSDLRRRPEGVRLKHAVNGNALKLYDKQGSVLRVETTVNEAEGFQVFRPKEGGRKDRKAWRTMRRGIADLARRAEVCQAANERYLEALAQVDQERPVGELLDGLCRPASWRGKRVRALQPWGADAGLLAAVGRGEYALNGLRNRDLRLQLYPVPAAEEREERRRASRVTRQLRLLRAHGLVRKVSKTHRYVLTEKGRLVVVALSAVRQASPRKLAELAA
jgi:hypothetical protein